MNCPAYLKEFCDMDTRTEAKEILTKVYGHHAYHPGQQSLVEELLNNVEESHVKEISGDS